MQKKTIHRYEIIEQIGEGGMGFVYKARDPRIDRIVAIKTIKFGMADDAFDVDEKKKRFYREAKTSGKLFHQNIVTILDVDEYEDFSYLVMEYVEGEPLSRRLRGGQPISQEDAITIVAQVCDALNYAHGVGIIHRDIKPSNIMIVGRQQVKVADFGLAKMLTSASANITRTGGVVGTPFYMAPEQIRGDVTDGQADIFSLGVVLYECLTGAKPFVGESISTIIYKILHEAPVGIREFNKSLSPVLDTIVQKALAKVPADRYHNAADMANDMRLFILQDQSISQRTAEVDQSPLPGQILQPGRPDSGDHTVGMTSPAKRENSSSAVDMQTIVIEQELPPGISPKRKRWPLFLGSASIVAIMGLAVFFLFPGLQIYDRGGTASIFPTPTTLTPDQSPTSGARLIASPLVREETPVPMTATVGPMAQVPEETPAIVHEAMLSVSGSPVGARITLDNADIGLTPIQSKVTQGTHSITIRKDGFEAFNTDMTVNGSIAKPTELTYSLVPLKTRLTLISRPGGARISLNGKNIGKTPLNDLELTPGHYSLTLSRDCYLPYSTEIDLLPGKSLSLKPELKPAGTGSLNVNALPWATIFIDGENYQTTPRSVSNLPSGVHSLKLVHPDYVTYETDIEIPVDDNVKIFHDFEKANFGTIQVNAVPFGNVIIDDTFEGETPISRRVKIGPHVVKITHEGNDPQEFSVTIKGGETEKITAEFK